MFKIFLATFLLPILSFAQLVVSPAPVSGVIDLDSTSATIYFSNPSTTATPKKVDKIGFISRKVNINWPDGLIFVVEMIVVDLSRLLKNTVLMRLWLLNRKILNLKL